MRLQFNDLLNMKKVFYEQDAKKIITKKIAPPQDIDPEDAEIARINKKSEKIKALANLLKSKNDYKRAKIDGSKIEHENDEPAVYPNPQPQEPNTQPDQKKDFDIDSNLKKKKDVQDVETNEVSIFESISLLLEQEDESAPEPVDSDNPDPENEQEDPEEGSGNEPPPPQTKEEAEIAKIQAETEKIRAETGGSEEDPNAMGEEDMGDGSEGDSNTSGEEDMGGDPNAMDPNAMGGDPNAMDPNAMGGMGADPNDPMPGFGDTTDPAAGGMGGMDMGGMGGAPQKTPTTIGRIYIMTKIYYKLAALSYVLSNNPDKDLINLSKQVNESFEIYKLVISNMKIFKDKIDDTIIMYYQFIREVTKYLEGYYKGKSSVFN